MADNRLKQTAVVTAEQYNQGNIAGLDDAMTRRLIASTVLTESNGGKLEVTNAQGYVGRYQAGAAWLVDAGYVDADKLKNAMSGYKSEWTWADSGNKDKMDTFLADASNWKDGLSLAKYKQSAELQDNAFKINSDSAYKRAVKDGVLHEGDSTEIVAGFLKARHISGYAGAKAAVTGGREISDGNGTSNYDYLHDITRNRDGLDQFMSRGPRQQIAGVQDSGAPLGKAQTSADGVLKPGEKGSDIRDVQQLLNTFGYRDIHGHPLKADGDFGQKTKEAAQAFQQAHGLKDDGVVGAKTLEALKKAEQSPLISNSNHPDHALYQQALSGVEKLPSNSFHNHQERQNAAATMVFEAKVSGVKQIDHVMLSKNGEGLFAVQGAINDPAHHRIHIDKHQAAAQPEEKSSVQQLQETQQAQPPVQQQNEARRM
ncbi:MAG: peptidoglycan-binding domain-containing protein [Arenimonas sp.]